LTEHISGSARKSLAALGIAGAQIRRDVPRGNDGDQFEPVVGLDPDPGDAGMTCEHLQPGEGIDARRATQ